MSNSAGVRLRVMTYNVRGLMGLDRVKSMERVARVIETSEVDLVALQELTCSRDPETSPPDLLGRHLGMEASFVCSLATEDGDYGHALLSRYPITRVRHEILPRHPSLLTEPRSAVSHEVRIDERAVRVVSTHLALTFHERVEQLKAIADQGWLEADGPVIFLGDLNCLPWSRAFHVLRGKLHLAASAGRRYIPTWPAPLPFLALDHIFVSSHFDVLAVRAVLNARARWASDHVPLLAEVELT